MYTINEGKNNKVTQIKLEETGIEMGCDLQDHRQRKALSKNQLASGTLTGKYIISKTIRIVADGMKERYERRTTASRNAVAYEFLVKVGWEKAAYIALCKIVNSQCSTDAVFTTVADSITRSLVDEVLMGKLKEKAPLHQSMLETHMKKATQARIKSMRFNNAIDKNEIDRFGELKMAKQVQVGVELIMLCIETTGYFERTLKRIGKKTIAHITSTPAFEQACGEGLLAEIDMKPLYLPLVASPLKWDKGVQGGYHGKLREGRKHRSLTRQRTKAIQEEADNHDMPLYYRAANALQETGYKLDKWTMDIMIDVRDNHPKLCQQVGMISKELFPIPESDPILTDKQNAMAKAIAWEKRSVYKSKQLAMEHILSLAEMYRDTPEFFYTYYGDFRGRLYLATTFLSPQYSDFGKALLLISRGKALSTHPDALKHFKCEIANRYGMDKLSYTDRVKWVDDNHHNILAAAQAPLDSWQWWSQADKKTRWQFLQACKEYEGYVEQGLDFVSHIACCKDGSNNGLQHYSMMLRDEKTAHLTNVSPSPIPQDCYGTIGEGSLELIEKDYKENRTIIKASKDKKKRKVKLRKIANIWRGEVDGKPRVNRGIAKKPVMILPYGGARQTFFDNVVTYLKDYEADNGGKKYLADESIWTESINYLVDKLDATIKVTLPSAIAGMNYLKAVTRIVAGAGLAMHWITPSGFKIWLSMLESNTEKIDTVIGSTRVQVDVDTYTNTIDAKKMVKGIAPDFVHGMDSAHMVLTINKCLDQVLDMSFVCAHDSFGTTAADTAILDEAIKHTFLEMYEGNALEDFRDQIVDQLTDSKLVDKIMAIPLPAMGTLDPKCVLKSEYLFS